MIALVWDTSCLLHAMRADRLDVLIDCAHGGPDSPSRNVTTQAVVDELGKYRLGAADLPGFEVVHVDGLDEILTLAKWVGALAKGEHNRGEATVCAWADVHGATAMLDDKAAREVARCAGLAVHGTLWLIRSAVLRGRLTIAGASGLADALIADGARYPFASGGFGGWHARQPIVG
jgi:predicted nucleic acid-binding protein